MGRAPRPLEYREVVKHDGYTITDETPNRNPIIVYPDGTKVPRLGGTGSQVFRKNVLARDIPAFGPMCRYCGVNEATTVDHITPWTMVGDYRNMLNGAACCKGCNSSFNSHEFIGLKTPAKVAQLFRENRKFWK